MSKKFATLRDLSGGGGSGGGGNDSGSDSDEGGQSFFVGGSEHSGQQVVGPPRRAPQGEDVDDVFRQARLQGATPIAPGEAGPGGEERFPGGGARLGDAVTGSQPIARPAAPQSVWFTLYDNGVLINNEEFRPFDDPGCRELMESLVLGEVTPDMRARFGPNADYKMDRKYGKYEQRFAGQGMRLGSDAPAASSAAAAAPVAESAASTVPPVDPAALLQSAQQSIPLDEGAPTTQVQVRLPDGRRLVGRFNTTSTVAALRAFVATAAPNLPDTFVLSTQYPKAVISNTDQTLADASLLNAAVIAHS